MMQWNKTSSQRGRGAIWCMFGVVAVIVIILWYVKVIPVPWYEPAPGEEDKRSDSEATVKRVDRLSFFNATPDGVHVTLDLYKTWDPDWTTDGDWDAWPTVDLGPVGPGEFAARTVLVKMPSGSPPLLAIKCTVKQGETSQILKIRSEDEDTVWIVAGTFWYAKDKDDANKTCGQIFQTNGMLKNQMD